MNTPGFTADITLSGSTRAIDLSLSRDESHLYSTAQQFDLGSTIRPAIGDPAQQVYIDCYRECRAEGGMNCAKECSKATTSSPGHGEAKGTSDAQALCCIGKFAACLATVGSSNFIGQWGIPLSIGLCVINAMDCTEAWPCNQL